TWKIEVLGGYTSAILLLIVAISMVWQSVERLWSPAPIHYDEAIAVAAIGLAVNLICAKLLHAHHEHDDHHGHEHADHEHHDLNLRSAYLHVLADAATSVLAIVALLGGRFWGVVWLDPAMGIVGAALVARWAWGLLKSTGKVLLDAEMDAPVVAEVREVIAATPARLSDLHVWRVAQRKYACIVGLEVAAPASPDDFKRALSVHEELVHVTVEINRAEPATGTPS
ncbi:MAG TPA: CDF family Co(II)/Ni(II) efflux transporter DmeF, partial [Solimonas sp.]|nr:CDF family Co(II)/Ni(II) efflux transporter DmeF [Solimonas sp.]